MQAIGQIHSEHLECETDLSLIDTNSFQALTKSMRKNFFQNSLFHYFESEWKITSYSDFVDNTQRLARFFVQKSLSHKKIMVISEARPELMQTYFSCFMSNTICIPIDIKLSAKEISSIIEETDPELILVSPVGANLLKEILIFHSSSFLVLSLTPSTDYHSIHDIPDNTHIALPKENTTQTGMIIFTSGSTGKMKGVETSGKQILFQVYALSRIGFNRKKARSLSMLPMNHLFEVSNLIASMANGYEVCIAHSLEKKELGECLNYHRPHFIFTVPLFCKSIMNGIKASISDSGILKRIIFKLLYTSAKLIPSSKSRKKLFAPIISKLGGEIQYFITGGAATDPKIISFFKTIGIPIYEGYGLTETAPVITTNTIKNWRPGSVGQMIPDVHVRIDSQTGEIQTKGPHVMRGYYKDKIASDAVFTEDGWFKTGDIGHLDEDSYLFITGRSKYLIVLESGKNVHPEELEKVYSDIEFIQEISIFSDSYQNKQNANKIILVAYLIPSFLEEHGKEKAHEILCANIQERSKLLATYKHPAEVLISSVELPKTTTMKVKHFDVAKNYFAKKIK